MMTEAENALLMQQSETIELLLEELRDHLLSHDQGYVFALAADESVKELREAVADVERERQRASI